METPVAVAEPGTVAHVAELTPNAAGVGHVPPKGLEAEAAVIPQTDLRVVQNLEDAYQMSAAEPGQSEVSQIPTTDLRSAEGLQGVESAGRTEKMRKLLGNAAVKSMLIRGATEVVGVGVDAALMGAGSAGVGLLQPVANRELAATLPEVAVLDKVLPHEGEGGHRESRARKLGFLALGIGTAIVAQKAGTGFIEHVAANMDHGTMHFAVPLATKVGAMSGLNAARKRIPSRSR